MDFDILSGSRCRLRSWGHLGHIPNEGPFVRALCEGLLGPALVKGPSRGPCLTYIYIEAQWAHKAEIGPLFINIEDIVKLHLEYLCSGNRGSS